MKTKVRRRWDESWDTGGASCRFCAPWLAGSRRVARSFQGPINNAVAWKAWIVIIDTYLRLLADPFLTPAKAHLRISLLTLRRIRTTSRDIRRAAECQHQICKCRHLFDQRTRSELYLRICPHCRGQVWRVSQGERFAETDPFPRPGVDTC